MERKPLAQEGRCIVCGETALEPLLTIPNVPVHCNVLWDSRDAALAAPRGDIDLALCLRCGHVQNTAFDPSRVAYTASYENSLHFSPRFQAYAEALARRLVEHYDLHHKTVLEIGSGKGEFLRRLAELGDNHGIGFDPSYVPDDSAPPAAGRLTFITDLYTDKYATYDGDLICCRQVLEHLAEPAAFLRVVRAAIGERASTGVFFEVPNALFMLRDLSVWDIIYEHPSYFSAPSLAEVFTRADYAVDGTCEAFEGQFLWLDAHPGASGGRPAAPGDVAEVAAYARAFGARYRERVAEWREHLGALAAAGRRVVIWGSGSKGVTFLNALQGAGEVSVAVDVNPRKRGHFVAGTGQEIVAPEDLRASPPDVVVVMNRAYLQEIAGELARQGLGAELLLA